MPNTNLHERPRTSHIVAPALLVLGALAAAGCWHGPQHVDHNAWAWNGALAAPGELHLRNLNGAIEVKPATDGNVSVTAETRWRRGDPKRDINFVVASSGNDVTVCAVWGRGTCTATSYRTRANSFFGALFRGGATDATVKFTVYVPTGVRVDASTMNGGVTVLSTAPVRAHTTNGNIKVGTAVGPVEASTVNGNVDARMTTLGGDGPVKVGTVNGSASAYLPANFEGAVHVATMNGRTDSDFAVTVEGGKSRDAIDGTIGAGGRKVDVQSVNGSASLRRLNADGTVAARP
jgi:hypothetical protein